MRGSRLLLGLLIELLLWLTLVLEHVDGLSVALNEVVLWRRLLPLLVRHLQLLLGAHVLVAHV